MAPTSRFPLLALPSLTRAAIDAAIPGLAAPRIEALLRIAAERCAPQSDSGGGNRRAFLADTPGTTADAAHLKTWLKERRGIAEALLRFDPSAVPAHLTPQLTVIQDGREIARGTDLSRAAARMCGAGPRRARAPRARRLCDTRQLAALRARSIA